MTARAGFIDELLGEIDLESWLDDMAIDYKRVAGGSNLNLARCPFCGDERSRVYMSVENKRGLCFHSDCNRKFNLWSFARAHLDADNAGTRRHFEDYASRVLGRPKRVRVTRAQQAAQGWSLPANVGLPTEDGMTHPYLTARSILPRTQAHFDLRWCEDGAFHYQDFEGTPKRMYFGGRILLPIYDLDGTLATFVGRDATGAAAVRYLFPPDLPSAARYLYGGNLLPGAEHLVMGEGPFDAIAIHQAIADHPDYRKVAATASFGLSIGHMEQSGDDQLGRLLRLRAAGLKRLTLMWDGEANAFQQAIEALKAIGRVLSGVELRLALLPPGKDPADVQSQVIRDAIEAAQRPTPQNLMAWTLLSPYK